MNLFENFNSAKQKYGIGMTEYFSKLGLPPQYLLSACRYVTENNIPYQRLVEQFKDWTKFVAKYNNGYDVNRLSYDDFLNIIRTEKVKHNVPNVIIRVDNASLGKLNNAKDVQKIPVENHWCIKSQDWFSKYSSKGYEFYAIFLSSELFPFTYVIAAIHDGNVEYYDCNDYEQFEDLRGGNEGNSDHEIYQNKLPNQIVPYLYNIAANQIEQREQQNTLNLKANNLNESKHYREKQRNESRARLAHILTEEVFRRFKRRLLQL